MLYTTLELCKKNNACGSGYRKLIKSLPDNEPSDLIPLTHIVESNGLNNAIWAFRATTEPCREFITDFALWCAEQVLDIYEKRYPDDGRVRNCLEGIRKYQRGEITKNNLKILRRAAAYATYATYAAYADAAAAAAYAAYAADAADAAAYATYAAYADADAAAYATYAAYADADDAAAAAAYAAYAADAADAAAYAADADAAAADAAAAAAAYAADAAYAAVDLARENQKQKFIDMLNEHKEK